MSALLDVNTLIALAWPHHLHHRAAREWFLTRAPEGWSTCSWTQAGFLRVSSNPAVIADAVSPMAAASLLRRYVARPDHEFWIDDVPPVDDVEGIHGYRQVTDAHLLTLAARHGGRVVSFDAGLAALGAQRGIPVESLAW